MNTDLYDVTLVGFPRGTATGETPMDALQRLFPIDEATANRFLLSMPVTVKHGASAELARIYQESLKAIGARVLVRPMKSPPRPSPSPTAHRPSPSPAPRRPSPSPAPRRPSPSPPPRRPSPSPVPPMLDGVGVTPIPLHVAARRPSTPVPTSKSVIHSDDSSFWRSIGRCFLIPFRGKGKVWLAVTIIIGFFSTLISGFVGLLPVVGIAFQVLIGAGLLMLLAQVYRATMASALVNEDSPGPLPEVSNIFADFVVPGIVIVLWFVTMSLPALLWHRSLEMPMSTSGFIVLIGLILLPSALWPMALARYVLTGSLLEMWNLPRVVYAVIQAPLEYGATLVTAGLSSILLVFLVQGITLTLTAIFGCGGLSLLSASVGLFLTVLVGYYGYGLMGALMGHLVRTNPDIAE